MKAIVLIVLGLAGQTALWLLWRQQDPLISEENRVMENVQVLLMLVGMMGFIWVAIRSQTFPRRTLFGSLALFYATFIILEVDSRAVNAPWFNWCFNGAIRNLWLGGLWVIAGGCFLRFWRDVWRLFSEWVASPAGICLLAAGGLWLASGACDKLRLFRGSHHFAEELFEVNAGILMLLCAVLTLRRGAVKTGACHPPGAGVNEDRQTVTTDQ